MAGEKITVDVGDWATMERLMEEGVASKDDWEEFVDSATQGSYWPGFIYKNVSAPVDVASVSASVEGFSGFTSTEGLVSGDWRTRWEWSGNPNHDKSGRFTSGTGGGVEPALSAADRETRDLIAKQIQDERVRKGLKPLAENSLRGYAIKEHARRQAVMNKVESGATVEVKTPVARLPIVGGTNDEKRAARRTAAFSAVGGSLPLFGSSLNIVDNSWDPNESAHNPQVSQHLQDLSELPSHLVNEFVSKGGSVWVGDGPITKLHPALAQLSGRQPRGWPAGTSYDDVAGVYFPDGSAVVLGANPRGSRYRAVNNFALHEFGHAVDSLRKKVALLSKEDRFTALHNAFKTAAGKIGKLNQYYVQGDTPAGASEFFADGTRAYFRGLKPGVASEERNHVVRTTFSETGTYVSSLTADRMLKYFDGIYKEKKGGA